MKDFEQIWQSIVARCDKYNFPLVQEKEELRFVFNLAKECSSYLEIGTAEGNSLLAISHSLKPRGRITSIDWCEDHTLVPRSEALASSLAQIISIKGDSHLHSTIEHAVETYDMVMIDAGHTFADVIADAIAYGGLATKYIIFHDIQLKPVHEAFIWYCKQQGYKNVSTFISPNSPYGYGIVKL